MHNYVFYKLVQYKLSAPCIYVQWKFVWKQDTYTSSSAILSTHMQLALKFSYKK